MDRMNDERMQYLTFSIAGDEYAIGILQVREVVELETLTWVPSTPPYVRGVVNLRGSVVPVVDLAVKFGLPESEVTRRSCVVIVELVTDGELTVIGVMADSVKQVIDLRADEIGVPPSFGTRVSVDFLLGIAKVGKKFALVLDIAKVLAAAELVAAASLAPGLHTAEREHAP
jgi:purine-binding chemotaxis protein CheW